MRTLPDDSRGLEGVRPSITSDLLHVQSLKFEVGHPRLGKLEF